VDPRGRACHLRQVRAHPVLVHLALCLALAVPLTACQSVPPAQDASTASVAGEGQTPAEAKQVVERILAFSVAGQTIGMVETRLEKAADGTWTSREQVNFSTVRNT
jgi:hypothetical protein